MEKEEEWGLRDSKREQTELVHFSFFLLLLFYYKLCLHDENHHNS